ncbi:lactadherin-like [Clavelina lepadiformis]|uniref:F5/8 type C domain-containing protein n=1 Tax=Clavelina lepadiformis TaxID=159417 RepID=A0ABP0GC46_CLALP
MDTSQGKRGPPGPKGAKGELGHCACPENKLAKLQQEIDDLRVSVSGVSSKFRTFFSNFDKVEYCSVGLKSGKVQDSDMTASSIYSAAYHVKLARLDNAIQGCLNCPNSHVGAWEPRTASPAHWVQVDLRRPTLITGVVTQGRPATPGRPDLAYWVTSYKVAYGNNTDHFQFQVIQTQNGSDLVFQGNPDHSSHVTNYFPSPVVARYFRIIVQTWNNYIALRLEYLTC